MKTPEEWIKLLDDGSSYGTGMVVVRASDIKKIQDDAKEQLLKLIHNQKVKLKQAKQDIYYGR